MKHHDLECDLLAKCTGSIQPGFMIIANISSAHVVVHRHDTVLNLKQNNDLLML